MWEWVTWENKRIKNTTKPYIYINSWQIKFNHAFIKLLEKEGIDHYQYINVWVNDKTHQLGFLFHNDDDTPCRLKISRQNNTFSISVRSIIKMYPWLYEIATNSDPEKRKFKPEKDEKIWVITVILA